MSCTLIEKYIDSDIRESYFYEYKYQRIFNAKNEVVGIEVLIDHSRSNSLSMGLFIHSDPIFSSSTLYLLERLFSSLDKDLSEYRNNGAKVFINIERSNLCDIKIIAMAIKCHRKAKELGVVIVLEVTERNHCYSCKNIEEGLRTLRESGVNIAIDDYDIYNGDYRREEISQGYYNYIKVEAPTNINQHDKLIEFLETSKCKVILEKIESNDCIENMKHLLWGMQGFAYHHSTPIYI